MEAKNDYVSKKFYNKEMMGFRKTLDNQTKDIHRIILEINSRIVPLQGKVNHLHGKLELATRRFNRVNLLMLIYLIIFTVVNVLINIYL